MGSLTRRRTEGRDQRRDQVRQRVLDAVEKLATDGESYASVSVERLASAAGISRATFYIYFSDKGDLLRAQVEQIVDELSAAAERWWVLDGTATRSDLRAALGAIIAIYRRHATLMAAVYDEATYDPAARDQVGGLVQGGVGALRKHIRRGQRQGWIDRDLLPGETAAWLGWLLERGLRDLVSPASDAEAELLADTLAEMVWNVLYDVAAT